jgi:hypothetical protein
MSAYTPGPWFTAATSTIGHHYVVDGDGFTICDPSPMGEANARLIANAPALADALRATLRCLEWHAERHGAGMDAKVAADARALLARIEGVTP